MRIAVCDDEVVIAKQVERLVDLAVADMVPAATIDVFTTGEAFWMAYQAQGYDLIFLDIEMAQLNGLEIGRRIREGSEGYSTHIVIVTAKRDHAFALYGIQPLEFLVKPVQQAQITGVIHSVVERMAQAQQFFYYTFRKETRQILYHHILYFQKRRRQIDLVSTSGVDSFYDTIDHLVSQTADYGFWQISQSALINYRQVKKFGYTEVTMNNDVALSISTQYRARISQLTDSLRKGAEK